MLLVFLIVARLGGVFDAFFWCHLACDYGAVFFAPCFFFEGAFFGCFAACFALVEACGVCAGSNVCGHAEYSTCMSSWSQWIFSCLFDDGEVGSVVVYARCEYDAWVSFRVLTGIVVSLEGLDHWS